MGTTLTLEQRDTLCEIRRLLQTALLHAANLCVMEASTKSPRVFQEL
jgi:hypothetical protein